MHCLKCGELAPEGSKYCPKCGALLENNIDEQDLAVVCASQKVTNDTPNDLRGEAKTKKRVQLSKTAKIVIVIIVILIIGQLVSMVVLAKNLVKTWYQSSDSVLQVMDIESGKMTYSLETGYVWMDMTLDTWRWYPISYNKIRVELLDGKWNTHTIEFNKDKNIMVVSPALTSIDDSETWVHIDD